jgi:hypothetical protein
MHEKILSLESSTQKDWKHIQLFKFEKGPLDGRDQYLPKEAQGWLCPKQESETVCYWYPYYRQDNVFVWDGRELTTDEANELT